MSPAQELDIEQKRILIAFVKKHAEKPFCGVFDEPGVNVLRLNFALDSAFSK
jgi:K+-transporting ATPase c subunit